MTPILRRVLLASIYLAALGVAGALVMETFETVRSWPTSFDRPPAQVMVVATATAVATPVPLLTLPTTAPVVPTPAPVAAIAQPVSYHPKTGRYIVAWLPSTMNEGALASFEANKDVIDDVSPFWYSATSSGQLYGNRNDELVRLAQSYNIRVIPSIHNVTANPNAIVPVLRNPQIRARHIQNIVDEVLARNYDGIDIDYEGLDASLREPFSAFMRELAAALKIHDKVVTVAVHAKSSDYGGLGGYQDWAEIGKHVDQLRIMTYDYHWRGSSPGPVAPAYWVAEVAEYARSVVDPQKVLIGVHFYGYDWPAGGNATPRPWRVIEELINQQGATVNFVERNALGRVEESTFNYRTAQGTRTVWFMTRVGLASKIETIQEFDLAGIAIWQLGYEKPEYWEAIREQMVQDPSLIQRAINPLIPEH